MRKTKRSNESIRKARLAILKEADRLQKAGIDTSHRRIVVGGSRDIRVSKLRERETKRK